MPRTVVVAGVGERIGESVARKFATEGASVALLSRSASYLEALAEELDETPGTGLAVPTDLTDPGSVAAAFEAVHDAFGSVDVLVYNAYPTDDDGGLAATGEGLLGGSIEQLRGAWEVWVEGAFRCCERAAADMLDSGGGTILFTGARAAVRGTGGVGHSTPCFGGRGLALSMARQLWPDGVHVAHVNVDGSVRPPGEATEPTEIDAAEAAETYWFLAEQPRSAWTLELDVRAHGDSIDLG
jgi:NAD(P)-dependent dehydrogenase (short-subunit alcohol dehydrogenase family)